MSRNYKFHNPDGIYFVSFAVVEWIPVFALNEYKDILIESLTFCQRKKGMEIYAWVIMNNHMHLVFRSSGQQKPELLLGDFKRFTSQRIVKAIIGHPKESRKELLLNAFKKSAETTSNVKHHQFWRHDNKPIELWSPKVIIQKSIIFIKILLKQASLLSLSITSIAVLQIMQEKKDCWLM